MTAVPDALSNLTSIRVRVAWRKSGHGSKYSQALQTERAAPPGAARSII